MNNSASRSLPRSVGSLAATLAVLICLVCFARTFNYSFRGNDDTLWYYLAAIELAHRDTIAPAHQAVREYLAGLPYGEFAVGRWKLREDYSTNSLLPSTLIYLSSRVLKPIVSAFRADIGMLVLGGMALGVTLSFLIGMAVLRWAIASSEHAATCIGALLGLGVNAALLALSDAGHVSVSAAVGPLQSVWNLIRLFFGIGPELSIFGYLPRSQVYLVMIAVFLLRWREQWTAGYALTVLVALLHQSMAGLLLAWLVVIDLIARPRVFDRRTIAVASAGVVMLFARESLFATLGLWPILVGTAIVLLAAAATYRFRAHVSLIARGWRLLDAGRQWLDRRGNIGADLVVSWALWLLSLPAVMIVVRVVDPASAYHFWGDIHIRLMGLLQPVTLIGLSILAIGRLQDMIRIDVRWLHGAAMIAAVLLAIPVTMQAITHYDAGFLRMAGALKQYNGLIGKPLPPLDVQTQEAVLYYAMAIEPDLQGKLVEPMLTRWPEPPRR